MTFSAGRHAWSVLVSAVLMPMIVIVMLLRPIGAWWWPIPLVVLWWVYVPFFVRSVFGECREEGLYVRYGVLWRREMHVPFSTLRTYEIWSPPLHMLFGCRTVVLRFAGGSVWLPLVDIKTASAIASYVEGR